MYKIFYGMILLCVMMSQAFSSDKVVLQLKWEHEFQFAGYYAALWQGYYKDVGIDLDIKSLSRPDGSFVSAVGEIQNGNADFAIGGVDILTAKDHGLDVVVLSSIFQRSQYAAYSLSDTPIERSLYNYLNYALELHR